MKVLVCDDRTSGEDIIKAIHESGEKAIVTQLLGPDLTKVLKELFVLVKECLDHPKSCKSTSGLPFDDVDLVFLDNNLAELEIAGTRLTAESIAGYVRAFTDAPYVVSLNKNPHVDFDLRYLVGDYATHADLALNTRQISNPALWTGIPADAKNGFVPWYWPCLRTVASRRRRQIEFIQAHFEERVCSTLNIPNEAYEFLSLHALGALYPLAEFDGHVEKDGKKPFEDVTFRDVFLARDRSLPAEADRVILAKSPSADVSKIVSRVVAADIDLWFRRDVLGPQEALVDVPHLLARMPFLLGKRSSDFREWNKVVRADAVPYGLDQSLYESYLAKSQFKYEMWAPSPAFWWAQLKADEKLNAHYLEVKQSEWLDLVFCEDCSAFAERTPKNAQSSPTEFSAEFEGSWGRRYVAKMEGIRYAPLSRFAI